MFEIPDKITNALHENKLVLFVGAGFSKSLGCLDWRDLVLKGIREFKPNHPKIELLKDCLTEKVLNEILVFDALKFLNKSKIIEIIKSNFNVNIDRNKLNNHKKLWKISNRIITSNYDKAIETVKPNTSIETISHNHLHEVGKSLKKDSWLFHIHGIVDNIDECVIFSDNYHKLYNDKHPAIEQLKSIASLNTILFIGFSMKDEYVGKLFKDLNLIFSERLSNEHFVLLEKDEGLINNHLSKLPIKNYNLIGGFLDKLIELKESRLQSPIPIKGKYLRRRCKSFYEGSYEFNQIMYEIHTLEFSNEFVRQIKMRISKLIGYENVIATAALHEASGDLEQMIELLSLHIFEKDQENTRLLYLAIGNEKLGRIKNATEFLDRILANPNTANEIALSAKFNRSICNEKIDNYDEVFFEEFISCNEIIKHTQERIKDKAVSNLLIVCDKRGEKFLFEKELENSIEYEFNISAKSQAKTIINYLFYKNEFISRDKYQEILDLSKKMDIDSKVELLCTIVKLMDEATLELLTDEIIPNVELLCKEFPSKSNKKHLDDLNRYLNDKTKD
jgi:hypothetical protein